MRKTLTPSKLRASGAFCALNAKGITMKAIIIRAFALAAARAEQQIQQRAARAAARDLTRQLSNARQGARARAEIDAVSDWQSGAVRPSEAGAGAAEYWTKRAERAARPGRPALSWQEQRELEHGARARAAAVVERPAAAVDESGRLAGALFSMAAGGVVRLRIAAALAGTSAADLAALAFALAAVEFGTATGAGAVLAGGGGGRTARAWRSDGLPGYPVAADHGAADLTILLADGPADLAALARAALAADRGAAVRPGIAYVLWWLDAESGQAAARSARFVSDIGAAVGHRAAGKFGRVSSTSIDEAAAAARAAAVGLMTKGGRGGRRFVHPGAADLARPSFVRAVRKSALAAGMHSLLGDLAGGQAGRESGLRAVRRALPIDGAAIFDGHYPSAAAVATFDSIVRAGTGGGAVNSIRELWAERAADDGLFVLARRFESLPTTERELMRAGRAHALDVVLAVRRARSARLGLAVSPGKRRGWQGRLALVLRRFGRVARVLSAVCQGESLELACEAAGFGFQHRDGRSRAFSKAFDETGTRAVLCVRTGAAGRPGAVGSDIKRAAV